MAVGIKVDVDATGAIRALAGQARQVRFAAAVALTRTAQRAEKAVIAEMPRAFDRPTPYTLRATRIVPATRENLTAQVWLKGRRGDPASRDTQHLFVQVFGGGRGAKALETRLRRIAGGLRSNEFLVPATGAPLDAFGNVSAGVVRSILSQLGAANAADNSGYDSNVKRSGLRTLQSINRQRKAGTFFIPRPGSGLPRGIYQRLPGGAGKRTRTLRYADRKGREKTRREATITWTTRMIFKIVVGRPKYRPRLRFFDIGRAAVAQHFDREFAVAYQRALATAR